MEQTNEPDHPDQADVAFHPPLLLMTSLGLSFLLRWVTPLPFLTSMVAVSIGPAIVVLSFALFFWTVYTMVQGQASIPTNKPTDVIVKDGPFRVSRNPIYLSMILLQLGIGIWANSMWFLLVAAASAGLLMWGVIFREERYLERKFGERYSSYKADVRRWI